VAKASITPRLSSVLALGVLASACGAPVQRSHYDGKVFVRGSEHFQVVPPASWERVDAPAGDLAFRHPESKAVIAANATCRGHHDPPLGVLVNDLLIGTTARKVLLDEDVTLDGRAAEHQVISLLLDGVPLVYDLYVLKKDGCVYDLTLVCRPPAYDGVADQFVAFVAGFRSEGEGAGE
jgi:hypothetical protein